MTPPFPRPQERGLKRKAVQSCWKVGYFFALAFYRWGLFCCERGGTYGNHTLSRCSKTRIGDGAILAVSVSADGEHTAQNGVLTQAMPNHHQPRLCQGPPPTMDHCQPRTTTIYNHSCAKDHHQPWTIKDHHQPQLCQGPPPTTDHCQQL